MQGDISRITFRSRRNYAAVLLQQGRVSTDADANEWAAVILRRFQAESLDTIDTGVSTQTPDAFLIDADGGSVSIGTGRMYVDGLIAENHGTTQNQWEPRLAELRHGLPTDFQEQPYYPNPAPLPSGPDPFLVYLKVWQRGRTALEVPELLEPALGGIDTTTRLQTVWQVKALEVPNSVSCSTALEDIEEFVEAEPGAGGRLSTDTIEVLDDEDPCRIPPGAGFLGTENQLYRVEIHDGGKVGGASGASFKWSRDNGIVASRVTHINGSNELIVESLGRDEISTFSGGDWVEITDDVLELRGLAGHMARIDDAGVDEATRTITLTKPLPAGTFPVDAQGRTTPERNTRVRRWDQRGQVLNASGNVVVDLDDDDAEGTIPVTSGSVKVRLEHGITVRFKLNSDEGLFRTGDYWVFAARTATGSIEFLDQAPAHGVHAHYAKLAMVSLPDDETDCRKLFPPLADRLTLHYVGGDTQQALPDVTDPDALIPLEHDLVVGVANGGMPVAGASIRFTAATGRFAGDGPEVTVASGPDGLAAVPWEVDSINPVQTAAATLLSDDGDASGLPLQFSATLARADRVAYLPDACPSLAGTTTVQEAIDRLCSVVGSGCDTLALTPQTDWIDALESLTPGTSATVCFAPGDYTTDRPVRVRGLRHVHLHGAGAASSIVARGSESALVFSDCASVRVFDLGVAVSSFPVEPVTGTQGTVTTLDCGSVEVSRCTLSCPTGARDRAGCLTVRNGGGDADADGVRRSQLARVTDCDFVVGHAQTGVLIVNSDRVLVAGCHFRTPPLRLTLPILLSDPVRLKRATNLLASKLVVDTGRKLRKETFNTAVKAGSFVIRLNSPVPEAEWKTLIARRPPSDNDLASAEAMTGYIETLAAQEASDPSSSNLPTFTRVVGELTDRLGTDSQRFLASTEGRLAVRTMLAGQFDVKHESEAAVVSRNVNLDAASGAIRFDSPLPATAWISALREAPPEDNSPKAVAKQINTIANKLLLDRTFSERFAPGFLAGLIRRNRASAASSVRVVGTGVGDVTVEGNSFGDTTEAVHVAASFRRASGLPIRSVGSVRIRGNDSELTVPFELPMAPRAIFVGNADRIHIEDNQSRAGSGSALAGVSLDGQFGDHVVVRDNTLADARTGVRMVARGAIPDTRLWLIADNMTPGATTGVAAHPTTRVEGNVS